MMGFVNQDIRNLQNTFAMLLTEYIINSLTLYKAPTL